MVGLPGAGKSTLVAALLSEDHIVVSKDHWPNARRREQRQLRVIEESLRAGQPVVVDNTNASIERRAPLLALARRLDVSARAVFVDTPFEVCVIDYLAWRQGDAARCALNAWVYWTLRDEGHDPAQATATMKGLA